MIKVFIERPVLATVVSIIIVILGFLGLTALPITQYPDIAPPTISVNASYAGANAETILESVIIPIEEQINGVEGMTYIKSSASNTGTATITVFFDQDVDPDIAAVNVQNRVARANSQLPQAVLQTGVTTSKQQTSALMFMSFFSENPDYDATFIQNYLKINVIPELQRVDGVGERLQLDHWVKMMVRHLLIPSNMVVVLKPKISIAALSLKRWATDNS